MDVASPPGETGNTVAVVASEAVLYQTGRNLPAPQSVNCTVKVPGWSEEMLYLPNESVVVRPAAAFVASKAVTHTPGSPAAVAPLVAVPEIVDVVLTPLFTGVMLTDVLTSLAAPEGSGPCATMSWVPTAAVAGTPRTI